MEQIDDIVLQRINELLKEKARVLVAIDGRCASGKSSLAARLKERCGCGVISMDDFFLRPEQRTLERLQEAGGNVDRERFLEEVLLPLRDGKTVSYAPFDCRRQGFGERITIEPRPITVIEGAYSCHPALWELYDLRVFLGTDADTQLERVRRRNGEDGLRAFREKWIPMEERYFRRFQIQELCDLQLES